MPDESPPKHRLNSAPVKRVGALAPSALPFGPRSDLTYQMIERVELEHVSLRQSLLTGTILRDCKFTAVDFSRCDLDGMRVEGCSFVDCEFANADIRSSDFSRCQFVDTSLSGLYLTDTTFETCSLIRSSFSESTITECIFTVSSILDCSFTGSSWTLNRFEGAKFADLTIGDCTFLYAIMSNCSFSAVRINAESVGMVFGLSTAEIESLGFVYLGEEQNVPADLNVERILGLYVERGWSIGVLMLRLNARLTSDAHALRDYFYSFYEGIRSDRPVRSDELQFVLRVLREMRRQQRLPLLNLIEAVDSANQIASDTSDLQPRARAALERASGSFVMLVTEMLGEFESKRIHLNSGYDHAVKVQAVFTARPTIQLDELLNALAIQTGLPVVRNSVTVDRRQGSYVEVIWTTLSSLLALQIFLYLVNGCMIEVTKLRARWEVLTRKQLPPAYRTIALSPAQELPTNIRQAVQQINQFALNTPWLSDPSLRGLNGSNVRELDVLEVAGDRTDEMRSLPGESSQEPDDGTL